MLLFDRDREKFFQFTALEDEGQRVEAFGQSILDIALSEFIRYGIFNESEDVERLQYIYSEILLKSFDDDVRRGLLKRITELLGEVDFISATALMPFVYIETNPSIVASAVIDYASLFPLIEGDTMTGPKDVIQMIEGGGMGSSAGAFGGLLHLGDPRVCRLLWSVKEMLDLSEVSEALRCSPGILYSATIEFELNWLESLEGDLDDGLFGVIVGAMVSARNNTKFSAVMAGERPFPINSDKDGRKQRQRPVFPLEVFADRIAPKLYALERSEPNTRIMPNLILAWGLEPMTSLSEAAPLDDRFYGGALSIAPPEEPDRSVTEIVGEWDDGDGQIFLAWGILNPDGPTLYTLGERRLEGSTFIFFRWMHMLGGRTYAYGPFDTQSLTYGDIEATAATIKEYLAARGEKTVFSIIPDFLLVNAQDQTLSAIAKSLMLKDAAAHSDWGAAVAYQDRFGTDFFGKAACHIRVSYEALKTKQKLSQDEAQHLKILELRCASLPDFFDTAAPDFHSSPATEALYAKWSGRVETSDWRVQAFGALAEMWKGSTSLWPVERGSELVSFDQVIDFLSNYNLQFD